MKKEKVKLFLVIFVFLSLGSMLCPCVSIGEDGKENIQNQNQAIENSDQRDLNSITKPINEKGSDALYGLDAKTIQQSPNGLTGTVKTDAVQAMKIEKSDHDDLNSMVKQINEKGSDALHGLDAKTIQQSPDTLPETVKTDAVQAMKNSQKQSPVAQQAYQQYLADSKRQAELEKMKNTVVDTMITDSKGNVVSKSSLDTYIKNNTDRSEYANKYLTVFISSSMPKNVIQAFMEVYGDNPYTTFVIRGVIDNDISKIKPTIKWVRQFICVDESHPETCHQAPIDINPDFFTRFKIKQVPAVMYTPLPAALAASCDGPISPKETDYFVVYGDAEPLKAVRAFMRERPNDAQLYTIAKSIFGNDLKQANVDKKNIKSN